MKKRFSLSAILSICFGCAIIVLMFAACSKKSERTEGSTQSQTATAEQTQTVVMQTANPHPEILNGDLSAFAGIWVNGEGIKQEVRADGTVYKEGSNDARAASGFQRLDNDSYYWLVSILNYEGMGRGAFNAQLYPVGVEVIGGNGKISTDTSKVRMFYPEVDAAYRSEEIYYRADEASTLQSNSKESQFVYTVQFNNQTIPITVFYSVTGADREGMDLDRMVFMYGNTEQTINLSPKVIEAGTPQGFFSYYAIPADYNFDGFLDFAVHHGHFSGWDPDIIYKVFLYNQQTANYSINEELSKLPNVRANNETQTVISVDGPVTSEYKWVNGKLELIKSESQAFSGPQ